MQNQKVILVEMAGVEPASVKPSFKNLQIYPIYSKLISKSEKLPAPGLSFVALYVKTSLQEPISMILYPKTIYRESTVRMPA